MDGDQPEVCLHQTNEMNQFMPFFCSHSTYFVCCIYSFLMSALDFDHRNPLIRMEIETNDIECSNHGDNSNRGGPTKNCLWITCNKWHYPRIIGFDNYAIVAIQCGQVLLTTNISATNIHKFGHNKHVIFGKICKRIQWNIHCRVVQFVTLSVAVLFSIN